MVLSHSSKFVHVYYINTVVLLISIKHYGKIKVIFYHICSNKAYTFPFPDVPQKSRSFWALFSVPAIHTTIACSLFCRTGTLGMQRLNCPVSGLALTRSLSPPAECAPSPSLQISRSCIWWTSFVCDKSWEACDHRIPDRMGEGRTTKYPVLLLCLCFSACWNLGVLGKSRKEHGEAVSVPSIDLSLNFGNLKFHPAPRKSLYKGTNGQDKEMGNCRNKHSTLVMGRGSPNNASDHFLKQNFSCKETCLRFPPQPVFLN